MSNLRALLFFIIPFTVCVSGDFAPCQAPLDSPKYQVKKLAFEVNRGILCNEVDVLDDPLSSKPRRLVAGIDPAWSPDGQRIAYGTRDGGRLGQIYVINADGSGRRQLTRVKDGALLPDWSPDGEKIAFTSWVAGKSSTIWIISKDGGNAKSIAEGIGARWSPDGSRLVFLRPRKKRRDKGSIWVVNADGTGERKVRDNDSPTGEVTWSPDGNSIAFASQREHKSAIFRVNLDGTDLKAIASDERASVFFPVFSPDGRQLIADAFPEHKSREVPASWLEAGLGDGTIVLVDLTGRPTKVLAHGTHPTAIWAYE
jgi:Tol biopolymer transport system component